jgi:hypothetical protein
MALSSGVRVAIEHRTIPAFSSAASRENRAVSHTAFGVFSQSTRARQQDETPPSAIGLGVVDVGS